jgi:hypothetical protein
LSQAKISKAEKILDKIISADPTQGAYGVYLVDLLIKKNINIDEDHQKILKALTFYDELKKNRALLPEDANIFSFKQLGDLLARLEIYQLGAPAQKQKVDVKGMVKITAFDPAYTLWQIMDWKTLQKISRETDWCTSNEEMAQGYLQTGRVFLLTQEKDGSPELIALIHFPELHDKLQEYEVIKDKIRRMIMEGVNPLTGEPRSPQEYRKELKDIVTEPIYDLVATSSVDNVTWYEYQKLLKELSGFEKFLDAQEANYQDMNLQIRDTHDRMTKKLVTLVAPYVKKIYMPPVSAPRDALINYYREISNEPGLKFEKDLIKLGDPHKLVDFIISCSCNREVFMDAMEIGGEDAARRWDKLPPLGYCNRWATSRKRAEKIIFSDHTAASRYYEAIQKTLSPKENQQFQKKLKRTPTLFEWPVYSHRFVWQRLAGEEILGTYEQEIKELREWLDELKEGKNVEKVEAYGAGIAGFDPQHSKEAKARRWLSLLKENYKGYKEAIKTLILGLKIQLEFWDAFISQAAQLIDTENFTADILYAIYQLYYRLINKKKIKQVKITTHNYAHDAPLLITHKQQVARKRWDDADTWDIGENLLWSYPSGWRDAAFPHLTYKHDIEVIFEGLINRFTSFGMIALRTEDGPTYVTPETLIRYFHVKSKKRGTLKSRATAQRRRTLKRQALVQQDLVDRINKEFSRDYGRHF